MRIVILHTGLQLEAVHIWQTNVGYEDVYLCQSCCQKRRARRKGPGDELSGFQQFLKGFQDLGIIVDDCNDWRAWAHSLLHRPRHARIRYRSVFYQAKVLWADTVRLHASPPRLTDVDLCSRQAENEDRALWFISFSPQLATMRFHNRARY